MTHRMITIVSDASYCSRTNAAGWGAWAKRDGWDRGRIAGGPMRRAFPSINAVELCGIASAFHHFHTSGVDAFVDIDTIVLQCDNVTALGMILFRIPAAQQAKLKHAADVEIMPSFRKRLSYIEGEAIEAIEEITGDRQLFLRHVRGHGGSTNGRSWVNEQCDAEAKRHMYAVRRERDNKATERLETLST